MVYEVFNTETGNTVFFVANENAARAACEHMKAADYAMAEQRYGAFAVADMRDRVSSWHDTFAAAEQAAEMANMGSDCNSFRAVRH